MPRPIFSHPTPLRAQTAIGKAGGALSGFYPNPTLAVGTSTPAVNATTNFPLSYSYGNVAGVESSAIVSCPITTNGGTVLIEEHGSLFVTNGVVSTCALIVSIRRDGTLLGSRRYDLTITAGGKVPIAGFGIVDSPPPTAGAHTYTVTVTMFATAGTTVQTPDNTGGFIHAVNFA